MGALPVEPPLHPYDNSVVMPGLCAYKNCGKPRPAGVHNVLTLEGTIGGVPVPRDLLEDKEGYGLTERTFYDTHAGRISLDNPPTTPQEFLMFFDQCVQLMQEKNLAYGDAWRRQGYMGNLARIMSKSDRLRNLLWTSDGSYSATEKETIEDTLRDMVNLAVFMWLNYRDGNQWGR